MVWCNNPENPSCSSCEAKTIRNFQDGTFNMVELLEGWVPGYPDGDPAETWNCICAIAKNVHRNIVYMTNKDDCIYIEGDGNTIIGLAGDDFISVDGDNNLIYSGDGTIGTDKFKETEGSKGNNFQECAVTNHCTHPHVVCEFNECVGGFDYYPCSSAACDEGAGGCETKPVRNCASNLECDFRHICWDGFAAKVGDKCSSHHDCRGQFSLLVCEDNICVGGLHYECSEQNVGYDCESEQTCCEAGLSCGWTKPGWHGHPVSHLRCLEDECADCVATDCYKYCSSHFSCCA